MHTYGLVLPLDPSALLQDSQAYYTAISHGCLFNQPADTFRSSLHVQEPTMEVPVYYLPDRCDPPPSASMAHHWALLLGSVISSVHRQEGHYHRDSENDPANRLQVRYTTRLITLLRFLGTRSHLQNYKVWQTVSLLRRNCIRFQRQWGLDSAPSSVTSSVHGRSTNSGISKSQVTGTIRMASHRTNLLVLFLATRSRISFTEVLSCLDRPTPPNPSQESRKVFSTTVHPLDAPSPSNTGC